MLLLSCRFLFLGILLLLLTRPLIREVRSVPFTTTLYLALDDTRSMAQPINPADNVFNETKPTRWRKTLTNLSENGIIADWERAGFQIRYGLFSRLSDRTRSDESWSSQLAAHATPEFSFTDISAVIDSFSRQNRPEDSAYLLLFSDGCWNTGQNPIAAISSLFNATNTTVDPVSHRIYTFGIGASTNLFDVVLESATLPPIARAGESLTLQARIVLRGDSLSSPAVIQVRGGVKDGGETYFQERALSLNEQRKSEILSFEIPTQKPGDYVFTVEITPLEGELSKNNNRISKGVRVRKAQDPVLLLTGAPDWEWKFLKRVFEDYDGIDPQAYLIHENGLSHMTDRSWILRQSGQSTNGNRVDTPIFSSLEEIESQMDRWSAIVLHNFPFSSISTNFAGALRAFVENGKGMIFIPGPLNTALPPPNLRELLPSPLFQMFTPIRQQVFVQFNTEENSTIHAALKPFSAGDLPPLFPFYRSGAPLPGSQNLLAGFTASNEPVKLITQNRFGLGRIMTIFSPSFWKWNLLTGKDALSPFWLSVLFQSNPTLQLTPGQLYTDGFVYSTHEPVQVSYAAKESIRETTVSGMEITVTGPMRNETLWLEPAPSQLNLFEARFTPIDAGAYVVSTPIGDATAEFHVEQSTIEWNDLNQNVADLRAVAEAGGGEYANEPAWQNLAKNLPQARRTVEETQIRFLGEKWWIFISMLLFLTLEWFIRRQQGLP
ncbi:MAG: hypothetical protein C4527_12760 [Candidatus Omnitrophota bacterium]|jgi:hypothetical protein|nr:MAG: hypothetical protein C4527_12760 [Candidatus Omnitrophota bacterium]